MQKTPPSRKRRTEKRYLAIEDRPRVRKAQAFSILTLLSGCAYLVWVILHLNHQTPVMGAFFLTAEVACLALFLLTGARSIRLRHKPLEGLPLDRSYAVDVFITTAGEPVNIVGKCMHAAAAIDWPQADLRIYLLDDANVPELKRLAGRLGIQHLSRLDAGLTRENAKAGNLNFGLRHSAGELVLTLDADQAPKANILRALVGYMKFEELGFIQSAQHFYLPMGDPFYNGDHVFYGTMQKAFDESNSVVSCGSGVLYRRRALEDIGGFVEWNLVEDLATSYEIHARGWKSFYYPHALTRGLAPWDINGVYHQRSQWALDTFRLFIWDNMLFKKGLTLPQKMGYLSIPLAYLCSGFVFPVFFIIPLWGYITGEYVIHGNVLWFFCLRLFYFLMMAGGLNYMFDQNHPGKQFQMLFGIFPVYAISFVRALFYPKGRKPAYRVTNVGRRRLSRLAAIKVLPQLLLFWANAALPFFAIFSDTSPGRYILLNALVSGLGMWLMWQVLSASLRQVAFAPGEHPDQHYA
ncbi:MAG: cellulose synthase catalytic subunit [Desulfosarcinaceae bacterium]|nr:cellulose synthase catalytic subunit [Desulfosarcinaceae bacterium]